MARKPQPPATATPVRWTDDEWKAIAEHIAMTRGAGDPAALDAAEIKAKEVFLAQDVLPKTRHRKLISIQQGFDASRKRLQAHLSAAPSRKLKGTRSGDRGSDRSNDSNRTIPEEMDVVGFDNTSDKSKASHLAETPVASSHAALATADSLAFDEPGEHANPKGKRPEDQSRDSRPGRRPVSRKDFKAASTAESSVFKGESPPAAPVRPERADIEQGANEKGPALHGSDFVELARPFVAMVCEELASAFVKAFGASATASALSAATRSGPTVTAAAAGQDSGHRASSAVQEREHRASAPADGTDRAALYVDDDQNHVETDVQPLFDPKLPPAANSPFRPKIALVASRADEHSDLQQRFPQLELIAVTLDDLRSNPVLRTCQRIVGLREDVPAAADEYLRRTFGSRYFRANGGATKVREQLHNWLNNPSGSAGGFRPPRQGGGKGAGAKKKPFRRPRE